MLKLISQMYKDFMDLLKEKMSPEELAEYNDLYEMGGYGPVKLDDDLNIHGNPNSGKLIPSIGAQAPVYNIYIGGKSAEL